MTKILHLTLLFLLLFTFARTQNIEEIKILAEKEVSKSNFLLAEKLYKRIIFFSENNSKANVYGKLAHIYILQQKNKDAISVLDSAILYSKNTTKKDSLFLEKAKYQIFTDNYNLAINSILSISNKNYKTKKQHFFLATAYYGLNDYKNSEKYFIYCVPENDTKTKSLINLIFKKIRKSKYPNPKFAKTMSRILPGSGQLYSQDYKNAGKSLLLISVFVAIGVDMYFCFGIADSIISVSPWLIRYYKSGYRKAEQIAISKKEELKNKNYNKIIELLK